MQKATEAHIGMGSNLDDPLAQLKAGIAGLKRIEGFELLAVSSPYISAPVGVTDQPRFINTVARGMFKGEATQLLKELLAIENQQGRVRQMRWGPRTLDMDLLLFGEELIDLPHLRVPHPEICNRAFVLIPLIEISPELVLPFWQQKAAELLAAMHPAEKAAQAMEKIAWDS